MTIERIEATYRVITPLFCTGIDPEQAAVRVPSFKGVLRWWWRALAWPRLGELDAIRAEEDALFGSARSGRGKVSMRLLRCDAPRLMRKGEVLKDGSANAPIDGARYLGYGVVEAFGRRARDDRPATATGELRRACINAPFTFTIELGARQLAPKSRDSLLDALKAVGLLGGMGAKSRKGYGSLMLESLSVGGAALEPTPTSIASLAEAIRPLLAGARASTELPPYTAFSSRARIVLLPAVTRSTSPLILLDHVGREIMRYRSKGRKSPTGRHHEVLGKRSEGNFLDDHRYMLAPRGTARQHPRRIVFGLPHNYIEGNVEPEDGDRRASPLFIHIHQCSPLPVAVVTFLPARFLPQGRTARVNVNGRLVPIADETKELWEPVNVLMERFLGRPSSIEAKTRKEPFGDALEVEAPR